MVSRATFVLLSAIRADCSNLFIGRSSYWVWWDTFCGFHSVAARFHSGSHDFNTDVAGFFVAQPFPNGGWHGVPLRIQTKTTWIRQGCEQMAANDINFTMTFNFKNVASSAINSPDKVRDLSFR
jgi:hypothetical protein